jgi:HEPN domain-containing protein
VSQDATQLLFENALQYYVAGRFGFFAQLHPTAAIQLHHAIEFVLKGALAHLGESTDGKHAIPTLWGRLKARVKNPDLDKFDRTIADLHKFHGLRYPDSILKRGMLSAFNFNRETGGRLVTPLEVPEYELNLNEVDELFGAIFIATNLNPKFFTTRLNSEAKAYLTRENAAAPFGSGKAG